MRREVRFGLSTLRRRPLLAMAAWSVPEALPAALLGVAVARAVDDGFLPGRPLVGLGWLGLVVVASIVGAAGSRGVFRHLGDLVEPFRDELVRRVVGGALRHAAAGRPDDGAVARLTRQVEIVRDTYAGLIVVARGFVVSVTGAIAGLLSIAPVIVALILPPFLLGFLAFLATLGLATARQRTAVRADERVAATAAGVLAGIRDVVARGAERHAAALVAEPVDRQATAERRLATVAGLRTICFAIGGWLPLVILLAAGPWLVARGVTAGAVMGGLTYVLFGLQPALNRVISGLGGSGLRFVVTLGRILDATTPSPASPDPRPVPPHGRSYDLTVDGVTFAYGPGAEPVLRSLDLTVPEGDHLAIVGPSGIGKSTLASILCGLLRPDVGTVHIGGTPVSTMPPDELASVRVLIPQEAYVFSGTVAENLRYLCPSASTAAVSDAVAAVGADDLVTRLGGLSAQIAPGRLSAGERQLLALVRAYLAPAPIVVLDEATCHLDPPAERRAEEAFAARGGTLVVIAHRISSARRARRVLVLDGARVDLFSQADGPIVSPLYRQLLAHWRGDSDPTLPLRDADRVDARAPAGLGHDPREVVADGPGA